MSRSLLFALGVALVLPACAGEPYSADPVPVTTTEMGDGDLVAVEPLEPEKRDRRRLDLDQLDASIRAATGYGWVDDDGNNLFETFARTLGRADYRQNTVEDRSTSLVFQKFLADAAHSACESLVQRDASRPSTERIFFVHAERDHRVGTHFEQVEANIRHLLLRFHSRMVESGADELDSWMWLHESAGFVSANPDLAWNAVCVGLITHPDFYTY